VELETDAKKGTDDGLLDLLPYFIRKEHIKDEQKRRPSDPNYDPETLFIPGHEWSTFTGSMT